MRSRKPSVKRKERRLKGKGRDQQQENNVSQRAADTQGRCKRFEIK